MHYVFGESQRASPTTVSNEKQVGIGFFTIRSQWTSQIKALWGRVEGLILVLLLVANIIERE